MHSRPVPFSIKNKHLLAIYSIPARGFTAAVSVFRGTPPPKPLKCKSVANRFGARIRSAWAHHIGGTPLHSGDRFRLARSDIIKTSLYFSFRSSRLAGLPFVGAISPSVSGNKKPCLHHVSRVREKVSSFFRTCLHRNYPISLRDVAQ